MRSLLALVAAAAVGGCGFLETCGPFGESLVFTGVTVEVEAATASDALTVLFVADGLGEFGEYEARPDRAAGDALRLTVEGETYELDAPPRFETAVRGDTVFVRVARDLFREVCSPARGDDYNVVGIKAPAGVRIVRFRTVWHTEVAFPASALPTVVPAARAPHFFTV